MKRKEALEFNQRQRFRTVCIWAAVAGVALLMLWGCVQPPVSGQSFGDTSTSHAGVVITTACLLLLTVLMWRSTQLPTVVNREEIDIRFVPFHLRYRFYN